MGVTLKEMPNRWGISARTGLHPSRSRTSREFVYSLKPLLRGQPRFGYLLGVSGRHWVFFLKQFSSNGTISGYWYVRLLLIHLRGPTIQFQRRSIDERRDPGAFELSPSERLVEDPPKRVSPCAKTTADVGTVAETHFGTAAGWTRLHFEGGTHSSTVKCAVPPPEKARKTKRWGL